MTQDELWLTKYKEVMDFMETNHRNPSKYRLEELQMLNWLKQNRKRKNAGKMKVCRVEIFEKLLAMVEKYKRVNQWK